MKRSLSKLIRGADSVAVTHRLPNEHNKAVGDPYTTRELPDGLDVAFGLKRGSLGREEAGKRRARGQKRY
jgi:hypothetical protein